MTLVIAFGHLKRAGKDTCANFLATMIAHQTRGLLVKKQGFAYELKQQCHRLYSWAGLKNPEYYDIESHAAEREAVLPAIGKSPRQIWLSYGTEVCRSIYEYTWIDILFNQPKTDILLITDLRFPNEFERVREMQGILVKINRPSIAPTLDIADKQLIGMPDKEWDYIVHNDNENDLKSLHAKVDQLFKSLVWPRLPGIARKV